MTLDRHQLHWLAEMFSGRMLTRVAAGERSDYLDFFVRHLGSSDICVGQMFEDTYAQLRRAYRNEYLYKNELAHAVFLDRHRLGEAALIQELRVGQSRADVCVFNGTSTVYEIKTDADTFHRLDGQLADYGRFFDRIVLVVSERRVSEALARVPEGVGVLAFSDNDCLYVVREAEPNREYVVPEIIFRSFLQREYLEIVGAIEPGVLSLTPIEQYARCIDIFGSFTAVHAHEMAVRALKSRVSQTQTHGYVDHLPRSLKALGLSMNLSTSKWRRLIERLHQPYIKM